MSEKRVLPANIYDTLEFSALAFGGIGAGRYWQYGTQPKEYVPFCYAGHVALAQEQSPDENVADLLYTRLTVNALIALPMAENDDAVRAINRRRGRGPDTRVPFVAWCKKLNIVRGDT